uniref:Secreted protein n=1 Tax=Lutzomyia longipalpis TaxID=7200 RepID=A0A7G3B1J2_LUTLO
MSKLLICAFYMYGVCLLDSTRYEISHEKMRLKLIFSENSMKSLNFPPAPPAWIQQLPRWASLHGCRQNASLLNCFQFICLRCVPFVLSLVEDHPSLGEEDENCEENTKNPLNFHFLSTNFFLPNFS